MSSLSPGDDVVHSDERGAAAGAGAGAGPAHLAAAAAGPPVEPEPPEHYHRVAEPGRLEPH